MDDGAAAHEYQLGIQRLREGRFDEAWPLYEARRRLAHLDSRAPIADCPEWRGEPLAGRKLAVVWEQGLGDQLMFGRYLPRLRSLGAEVLVVCNPRFLARFFERAGYATAPNFIDRPIPPADFWILFGSLPLRLGGPIPPACYLPMEGGGGGLGVVAVGNPSHVNDSNRSLPPELRPRLQSLGRSLLPADTGALDMLDTAEIVASLDAVITVDTAVAHLAGAIGKPCWVLLPRQGLDWRWTDGRSTPWYPDFRLYRQPTPGDWEAVLDQVALAARAEGLTP